MFIYIYGFVLTTMTISAHMQVFYDSVFSLKTRFPHHQKRYEFKLLAMFQPARFFIEMGQFKRSLIDQVKDHFAYV